MTTKKTPRDIKIKRAKKTGNKKIATTSWYEKASARFSISKPENLSPKK